MPAGLIQQNYFFLGSHHSNILADNQRIIVVIKRGFKPFIDSSGEIRSVIQTSPIAIIKLKKFKVNILIGREISLITGFTKKFKNPQKQPLKTKVSIIIFISPISLGIKKNNPLTETPLTKREEIQNPKTPAVIWISNLHIIPY